MHHHDVSTPVIPRIFNMADLRLLTMVLCKMTDLLKKLNILCSIQLTLEIEQSELGLASQG